MAFGTKASLEAVLGYFTASGHVQRAQIGEPKQPPVELITAAIFMAGTSIVGLYLNHHRELHVVTVRLYMDMLHEPTEEIEFRLAQAVEDITDDIVEKFALNSTVREVDLAGMNGTPVSTTWGYVDISGKMFRIVDITLPLNVDEAITAAA